MARRSISPWPACTRSGRSICRPACCDPMPEPGARKFAITISNEPGWRNRAASTTMDGKSTRLAIDEVDFPSIVVEAARLRQPGSFEIVIANFLAPGSGIGSQHAGRQIERPDLVHAGHGDIERRAMQRQVPRRAQIDRTR